MKSRNKKVLIVGTILYLVGIWLPLISMIGQKGEVSECLLTSRRIELLANSIKLGGCTAVIAGFIGVAGALFIHNSFLADKWYRFFFLLLMPVPYYIYALSWMYLIRLLSKVWPWLLKYSAQGFGACLFVEVMTYIPIAMLFCLAALEMRNRETEEIAMVYRSSFRVLIYNTLPEIMPYLAAAAGGNFLLSVTDFSVPSMFQYNTYTLEIYSTYSRTGNPVQAYEMSVPLSVLLLIPLSFLQQAIRKINRPQRSESSVKQRYPFGIRVVMTAAFVLVLCQVFLPVAVFLITAGNLQNIMRSFEMIYGQIGNSLGISLIAAVIAVLLTIVPASFFADTGKGILWMFALGTMTIPGALQAMGLLFLVNGSAVHGIGTTLLLPALGCALRYMPFALLVLTCARKRIDRMRTEMAILYENHWYQHILVEAGMLLPGILCAAALVFFLSFGEEGIILVLMPPGLETVSVKIYNYLHYGASEYVSGFCLIVMVFMFLTEAGVAVFLLRKHKGYGQNKKKDSL